MIIWKITVVSPKDLPGPHLCDFDQGYVSGMNSLLWSGSQLLRKVGYSHSSHAAATPRPSLAWQVPTLEKSVGNFSPPVS